MLTLVGVERGEGVNLRRTVGTIRSYGLKLNCKNPKTLKKFLFKILYAAKNKINMALIHRYYSHIINPGGCPFVICRLIKQLLTNMYLKNLHIIFKGASGLLEPPTPFNIPDLKLFLNFTVKAQRLLEILLETKV